MYNIYLLPFYFLILHSQVRRSVKLYCKNMGPSPSSQQQQKTTKKDEAVTLFQAGKLVKQLNLYSSERQLREQQHLLARMMIYGHSHLTEHLKELPRAQKFNFIRYLRRIDIETMDLLYQNYIHHRLSSNKKQTTQIYTKINYLDKKQQIDKDDKQPNGYQMMYRLGQILLQKKKCALLVFIGGNSSRFYQQAHQSKSTGKSNKSKQFYTQYSNQKSLMEIKLNQIDQICKRYGQQQVYIIHNQVNHKLLNQLLAKYTSFTPKKMLQNQNLIVTLSGKFCLKDKQDYQLYQSASGCGDFINCTIKNQKIIEDMVQEGIQYICCFGAQNILQNVADPYSLGIIHSNSNLGVVYKCTYPENQNQPIKRIVYNKSKKQVQVKYLQNLLQHCDHNSIQILKRSPIWTNSVIIRIQSLKQAIENRLKSLSAIKQVQQIYTVRKIKLTYYNPCEKIYQQNQYCYTFQRQISDLLMGSGMQTQAIMIPRDDEYMPVVSIANQMIWKDAYQQYLQKQQKKHKNQAAQTQNIKIIQLGLGRTRRVKRESRVINIESKIGHDYPNQNTDYTNQIIKKEGVDDSLITIKGDTQQI